MLRLIEAGLCSPSLELIAERIEKRVERGMRSFMIVPEQQTVIAEGYMSERLPRMAPLFFEVTNFTRFSNTVFRALGGLAAKYCDGGKRLLIAYSALSEVAPLLSSRISGEISPGVVTKYLSAIKEMQSLGVSAEELRGAADAPELADKARLRSKLTDLALVMSAYKRLFDEKYKDEAEDLDAVIQKLCAHPEWIADTEIYIDGFTSFTDGQYRLIAELSRLTSVNLTLPLPRHRREAFEYSEIRLCHERLVRYATGKGVEIKLERIGGIDPNKDMFLSELVENIWQNNIVFDNYGLHNKDILRIFEAKTPYDECDFVCADIKRQIADGAKYSDFAIIARSAESYSGILDLSLEKYGLSAFTSYKKELESYAEIKLIFNAYAVIRSGFSREEVALYSKCGFTGIERERLDELENYVDKWQIDRARFTDDTPWMMNPRGYESYESKRDSELLSRIAETREKLISPLLKLSDYEKGARTAREMAIALFSFLRDIRLEEQIKERADAQLRDPRTRALGEEKIRLYDTIISALEAIVEAIGDMNITPSGFVNALRMVFSKSELGSIPTHVDEIVVGSADMLRLYGRPHVYLIGVNEGKFPSNAPSSSYFLEREREIMTSAGLGITPEADVAMARELFCLSRAMSFATRSVTVLYSQSSESFGAMRPSEVISRIIKASDERIKPVRISELPIGEMIYSVDSALELLGRCDSESEAIIKEALTEVGEGERVRVAEGELSNLGLTLSSSVSDELYGEGMSMTQTKLDDYSDCPLKYFCRYNLALSDDSPAEFGARNIGTFIHAILENFFAKLRKDKRRIGTLSYEERKELTERAAKDYILSLGDGVKEGGELMKLRLKRLCRAAAPVVDGLCDEFSDCEFTPTLFELKIKDSHPENPSPTKVSLEDGTTVTVGGTIDRVDTYESGGDVYVRVVDYKTGYKDFSPEDLEKGENLQMFLYLKAITESTSPKFKEKLGVGEDGKIMPAGIIYVGTSIKDVKVKDYDDDAAENVAKATQSRQGMLLDDDAIIAAMNEKYLPISFKGGTVDEKCRELLYTLEGWQDIMKTVEDAVKSISTRIRSGNIDARPKRYDNSKTHCDSCDYKPICRKRSFS